MCLCTSTGFAASASSVTTADALPKPSRSAGVAHLTLPQDVIAAKADGGVSSGATLKVRTCSECC